MSRSFFVDTNILVRFFTGNPPAMAERARQIIAEADSGKMRLQIASVIVARPFTPSSRSTKCPKRMFARSCTPLRSRGIAPVEPDIILDALDRYRELPVHFADAYLASVAAKGKVPVYSFNEDFAKFKDVAWKR